MINYIPALSALLGVLVGSFISLYVAKLQFASTVISQYRKEWINRLQEAIADLQSQILRVNMVLSRIDDSTPLSDVWNYLQKASFISNKILLMLDPSDANQKKLQSLILQVSSEFAKEKGYTPKNVTDIQDEITDAARSVFASEWMKAKKGK
jgi:hypothetical protein